jgi:hypothetical protein
MPFNTFHYTVKKVGVSHKSTHNACPNIFLVNMIGTKYTDRSSRIMGQLKKKKKLCRYFQQDQTSANTANNFIDFIHVMFIPSTLASV